MLYEVPSAANFVVATFIIVEMADEGNEGMVYGLLTTTANLGEPFGNAISNQLFGLFTPSLSDSSNYISDAITFRAVVSLSFVVSYCMSFLSLLALPLLPDQKAEAQRRKREWPESDTYSHITIALVRQHGQSGRLGGGISGHRGPLRVHLKAWGCPPYSGGETERLTSHREDVA